MHVTNQRRWKAHTRAIKRSVVISDDGFDHKHANRGHDRDAKNCNAALESSGALAVGILVRLGVHEGYAEMLSSNGKPRLAVAVLQIPGHI